MAKDGMKRSAYCQGDPVFNEVWGKWRKEERRVREEARAMMPIRVMGIVRLLVKRAGYKLISDIEILDERTGNRYKSVTRNKGGSQ